VNEAAERPHYEVYAIRYATREGRRRDNFIGGDPHEGPMPMDYFVWVLVGTHRSFVVDCGFTATISAQRKRTYLRDPVEALTLLGIRPDEVTDVILTHLHYDHVGNFDRFPRARFHLQERELAYATGKYMRHPFLSHSFEVDDVVGVVRLNYRGRVVFYDGDADLAPGVRLHLAAGHSAGLQFVSVETERGRVVLASDVTHYYENMDSGRPYTTTFHVGDTLESYEKLRAIAASADHIVPGHDPLVMQLYPAPRPDLEGIAVRLDVPPSRTTA
jgi:glyoxylase-like metal-dependent hydrolase (beta-lactamase superfamily II)